MKIELTQTDVLNAVKPVTTATTDQWADLLKSIVYTVAKALAFAYALGSYGSWLVKNPGRAYKAIDQVVSRPSVEPAPEPVAVKPVRTRRSRKRSAKNANNTTPAKAVVLT